MTTLIEKIDDMYWRVYRFFNWRNTKRHFDILSQALQGRNLCYSKEMVGWNVDAYVYEILIEGITQWLKDAPEHVELDEEKVDKAKRLLVLLRANDESRLDFNAQKEINSLIIDVLPYLWR